SSIYLYLIGCFHFKSYYFQLSVPIFPKLSDKCLFYKFINRNLKFFSQNTGLVTNGPFVVVYCCKFTIALNSNRIQVARNGFSEVNFSGIESIFNSATGNTLFSKCYIGTFGPINQWGLQVAIRSRDKSTLFFNGSDSFWS